MRVLITGISGFVGSHLTDYLLNKNWQIFGTYRTNPLDNNSVCQFKCDINNYKQINKIIKDLKPQYLFHLAGPAFIPESYHNPRETIDVIVNGTLNILESLKEHSNNTKMLYIGSANEYGEFVDGDLPLKESSLLNPLSPYAVAKASASLLCWQYYKTYHLKIVRVRPFNHIGPRQSELFACANFAKQIAMIEKGMKNPAITVGNLDVYRDFLDVRDVVKAYWLILTGGQYGEVFNVCSGEPMSIKQLLNELIELSNYRKDINIFVDKAKIREIDFIKLFGSRQKLQTAINWHPEYDIRITLKDTLDYWREEL